MAGKFLDGDGLLYLWGKIKGILPTKTSELTNDSGFITSSDIPEGAAASTTSPKMAGTAAVGSEMAFARGDHVHPSDTSRVPTTRKVNGKALSADISLGAADVGARADSWMPSAADVGARADDWMPTAAEVGARPSTWMPNASDVGARPATWTPSAADVGAIATSAKGSANGVASLGADGKVPSSQLPSYVDDVVEGYYYNEKFYTTAAHTTEITGETGKIYVDLSTNVSYRYGGSAYVAITNGNLAPLTNTEIDGIVDGQ